MSAASRRNDDLRTSAAMAWHTAYLSGLAVNNPQKFPTSADKHFDFLRENKLDWRRHKAQMAAVAAQHNRSMEVKSVDR